MTGTEEYWLVIRHMLACRSGHCCEICGRPLDARREGTVHHRLPRGIGGTSDPDVHDLPRLMLLCGGRLGGVQGCHGIVERHRDWAYRNGYLIHRATGAEDVPDPADVPVVLRSGRRVLLTPYDYAQAPGDMFADPPAVEQLAA